MPELPELSLLAANGFVARQVRPYAEALRRHALMRAAVVDVEVPPLLREALAPGELPTTAWGAGFDELVSALIPHFTRSDALWQGAAMAIPPWSETTLLEAIGAPVRLRTRHVGLLAAAWARQQAALLAELTCTVRQPDALVGQELRGAGGAVEESFASVAASFASEPWIPSWTGSPVCHYACEDEGYYIVRRERARCDFTLPAGEKRWELVVLASRIRPDAIYENQDFASTAGCYAQVAASAGPTSANELRIILGDGDQVRLSPPAPGTWRGWAATDHRLILHHTFNL